MREIKFRAWDGVNNMWLDFDEYMIYLKIGEIRGISCCEMVSPRRDVVIEQFTGLKDKNGVDVYEGDIISASVYGFQEIGLVEYSPFGEWVFGNIRLNEFISGLTVIGNIHQNADLLEEQ
ncbi:YopX family protein [Leuconostoc pseudomesenteroides]|uniref:YopX family protein n=1 Tax=Leuconostoc pseudomesenteroides TaxID=33968 RepID=UPI0032DFA84F